MTTPGDLPFAAAGHAVDVSGNTPFLMMDGKTWLVQEGHVDVFTVRLASGEPTGPRSHLLRAATGELLIGVDRPSHEGVALLAVGGSGTRLVEAPLAAVQEVWCEAEQAGSVVPLVERWLGALYQGLALALCPPRALGLTTGAGTPVPAGVAQPSDSVCWVRQADSGCFLVGDERAPLETGIFVPVARPGWLEVRNAVALDVQSTAALIRNEVMWDGLRYLHALVLRLHAHAAEQAGATDRESMLRRADARRSLIGRAATRLAAGCRARETSTALDGGPAHGSAADEDMLLAAFRIVAHANGLAVKTPPRRRASSGPRDPLEPVLAASRIRARQVALRGEWWCHDHGALLAYGTGDKRPLALLWSGHAYVRHDPAVRTIETLGPKDAATVEPFARALYRPFPESALGLKDLVRFGLAGCRGDLRRVVFLALAMTALALVPPIATAYLFNTVIPGAERTDLVQIMAILAVCALCTALFNVARGIALLRVEARMGSAIQAAVWDRLLALPLAFFRPYTAGDLATRAMSIDTMRQLLSTTTVSAVLGGILSLGNFTLMFYYSVGLAWRASALIALSVAITVVAGALQLPRQRSMATLQARTSGLVLQFLSGIARLRVSGAEVPAFALWAERFSSQRRLQYKSRTIGNVVAAFNGAFPVAAHLVIFWSAASMLGAEGSIRTGDLLGFLSAFSSCLGAVLGTSAAMLGALAVIPLYEQAQPILEARPEVDAAKSDPGVLSGDIELHHAKFRYDADGPPVLRDISFHISPGEFAAFVGPSGSGKSTLLRLLLGFERVESGSIYYDGQEIGGLDVGALRRQIGVVLQNGRLMAGDVLTNIVGSGTATLDEAWEAARMAGFADDVQAMPMGMHTVISESGGTLSGGQRQRLMIARAIVHRPRILFFDEATSALDNRTQAVVSESLEKLQATRVVIAHRLSTIVSADRIFVVDRGQIVESGSYSELMGQAGIFAALARRQIH
ncbi:MAG: NHLP bacteriocin export ABC transporter permease/ATPase subunit [Acidobacteria bacterium]|nr:MAG: NHLP bacteriocin export ABC transporter permease/ATPase subunit [Acidobacteriota bacterium]